MKRKPCLSSSLGRIARTGLAPINGQAAHGINWGSSMKSKKGKRIGFSRKLNSYDAYGNNLKDMTIAAKIEIEKIINNLPTRAQAIICPRTKWAAVDLCNKGMKREAIALLKGKAIV